MTHDGPTPGDYSPNNYPRTASRRRSYRSSHRSATSRFRELDLRSFGAVIYTTGFRANYQWIDAPITDELGFPHTTDGASTVLPGLYLCGVHFLRRRRSSLLFGVGEDAALIARHISANQP